MLKCGKKVSNSIDSSNPNGKSKVAANLLGIFLRAFGVHNFYLGYTGKIIIINTIINNLRGI